MKCLVKGGKWFDCLDDLVATISDPDAIWNAEPIAVWFGDDFCPNYGAKVDLAWALRDLHGITSKGQDEHIERFIEGVIESGVQKRLDDELQAIAQSTPDFLGHETAGTSFCLQMTVTEVNRAGDQIQGWEWEKGPADWIQTNFENCVDLTDGFFHDLREAIYMKAPMFRRMFVDEPSENWSLKLEQIGESDDELFVLKYNGHSELLGPLHFEKIIENTILNETTRIVWLKKFVDEVRTEARRIAYEEKFGGEL